MGQLSAESRGLVRLAIDNTYKRYPTTLRENIKNHIDKICNKKFGNGKRLSIDDLLYFFKIPDLRDIPILCIDNDGDDIIYVYAEPCEKSLYNVEKSYDEFSLELRQMHIRYNRRKVRIMDMPLNLQISSHAVGRIFERGNVKLESLDEIVHGIMESMDYWTAIALQDDLIDVAFPYLNGMAIGELVDESALLDREMKNEWGARGTRSFEETANFLGSQSNVLRIRTFFDAGMLDASKENLMIKMETVFSDNRLINGLSEMRTNSIISSNNENDAIYSDGVLKDLFKSSEWKMVCG